MSHDLHRQRRQRLLDRTGGGVVLVRGGSRGGANPNFFYLTGLAEPRATLLLATDGVRVGMGRQYPGPDYQRGRIVHSVLFAPPADPLAAQWGEDAAVTLDQLDAAAVGVDELLPPGELDAVLSRALASAEVCHLVRAAEPSLAAPDGPEDRLLDRIRRRFPGVGLRDATRIVGDMRSAKDDGEVLAIERAIEITAAGLRAAMELARPGLAECEIEAELTRAYRASGAVHGFDPIVASGLNAVLLHYSDNSGRLGEGELLLIDTGASLGGYGADVTRTFPVDGRFTPRQREIYETVLAAQRAALGVCRPGVRPAEIHEAAYRSIEAAGYAAAFPHGTAHHLGLETHDAGDPHRPLEPGAVVTVEPGIYLPDEKLGIRIEDDVLITPDGHRVLSEAVPKSVEEIERAAAGDT